MNPGNAPLVVGQLLDDECPEDFIKGLILSVRSLLPVEPLVDECEKRFDSFNPPFYAFTWPSRFFYSISHLFVSEPGTVCVCSLNSWSTL